MRAILCCLGGCLVALAACDPNAKATAGDPGSGAAASAKPSTLLESCAASRDCDGELRCFEHRCVSTAASTKGDYFAAVGKQATRTGRHDLAIKQFRAAEAEYKAEGLEEPASLQCLLGMALTYKRQDPVVGEEAASRLHRCLLASPVGSAQRTEALRGLALLDDVGLDPVHLASAEVVDRYLTRAPRKPPTSKLTMKVTSDGKTRARSFSKWFDVAKSDQVKEALTPCWEAYWKASRKTKMVVKLPFKHSFRLDEYDDFDRATLVVEDMPAASDDKQQAANVCAKAALEAIADEHSRRSGSESRWTSTLTFELDT